MQPAGQPDCADLISLLGQAATATEDSTKPESEGMSEQVRGWLEGGGEAWLEVRGDSGAVTHPAAV